MGTFHDDKGELHGITVVVDTAGPEIYIGRCDEMRREGVVLLDVDVHRAVDGAPTKEAYLRRAAKFGVFTKHSRLVVPRHEVASIQPLGELDLGSDGAA